MCDLTWQNQLNQEAFAIKIYLTKSLESKFHYHLCVVIWFFSSDKAHELDLFAHRIDIFLEMRLKLRQKKATDFSVEHESNVTYRTKDS